MSSSRRPWYPDGFDIAEWSSPNSYGNDHAPAPKDEGVYLFLSHSDPANGIKIPIIEYVGSSSNIHKRLNNHEIYILLSGLFWHVTVFFKKCENYIEEEKELISKLSPRFNKHHSCVRI